MSLRSIRTPMALLFLLAMARLPAAERSLPRRLGTISDPRLREISGIACSRLRKGTCWVLNDSGDAPRIFAVGIDDGKVIAEMAVRGATAVDWECLDSGPGPEPGKPYLYIGDVGNNSRGRTDLRVYRILEPDLTGKEAGSKLVSEPAAMLRFTYPDAAVDAEGMAVHPVTGAVYLFAKKAAPAGVYRLGTTSDDGRSHSAEVVGTLRVPNVITGAAFSPDGTRLAIRTYLGIHELEGKADADLRTFLAREPTSIRPPPELQGEAIDYSEDGRALLTVSEGSPAPIWRIERREPEPPEAGAEGTRKPAPPAEAAAGTGRSP